MPLLLLLGLGALGLWALSSGGRPSAVTTVSEQVDRLLSEPHTDRELAVAADMLERAGRPELAAEVRAHRRPRLRIPHLGGG